MCNDVCNAVKDLLVSNEAQLAKAAEELFKVPNEDSQEVERASVRLANIRKKREELVLTLQQLHLTADVLGAVNRADPSSAGRKTLSDFELFQEGDICIPSKYYVVEEKKNGRKQKVACPREKASNRFCRLGCAHPAVYNHFHTEKHVEQALVKERQGIVCTDRVSKVKVCNGAPICKQCGRVNRTRGEASSPTLLSVASVSGAKRKLDHADAGCSSMEIEPATKRVFHDAASSSTSSFCASPPAVEAAPPKTMVDLAALLRPQSESDKASELSVLAAACPTPTAMHVGSTPLVRMSDSA